MSSLVNILWTVAAIVVVLWLLGLVFGLLGNFIHILLIVAAIIIVYNLLTGRRAV